MSRRALAAAALVAAVLVSACSNGGTDRPAPPSGSTSGPTSGSTSGPTSGSVPASAATARGSVRDWPTYHGTPDRAGVSSSMPAVAGRLTVAAKLGLDGAVYASPLVVGGLTIVATENDTVYAFDRSYRKKWTRHLGAPSPAGERACGNVDPLGITGTPTYDARAGLIYMSPQYGGPPRHQLVALKATDGSTAWQRSIDLPGVETKAMQQRGALAVAGGRVWVPFGGLAGDCGGYKGRLVGVALDGTGSSIAYTVPTTREAGIWTPPGPAVDLAGNLYVAVGNGAAGRGDPYDHSDSVLKIGADARLLDSFSPSTWASDNAGDLDLGSQGPTLVGPWVFSAGKSGTAYVLRRGKLGGIGGEVSQAKLCKSFGGTALDHGVVYVPCTDGLRAVRIDSAGKLHVLWHAAGSISGSPVVGGGRVWSLEPGAGVLHALDPNTGRTRERVTVGPTSRFATPALAGADVLVPTLHGVTVVRTS